ncbi:4-hydroxy-tetrahydrodipicolinate reductase [Buchnera aphidicola (Neophyllaphis podocarpi)]|uniref:4-hydroxy-tetrahydrodipicolinate reductase n=1 Tax=Buchnera aphidicola TaxID=9 RepID=UPI0034642590
MSKKNIRIAVSGALGKMGKIISKEIINRNDIILSTAIVKKKSKDTKIDINKIDNAKNTEINVTDSIEKEINNFDVLIEFSTPECTMNHLKLCKKYNKKIVIGTTGLKLEEKKTIKKYSKEIGIFYASNFSIGINIVMNLLKQVSKNSNPNIDIQIIESHHKSKIDSPSGTALSMEEIISKNLKHKKNKVKCYSIRAGNIIGEHKIMFIDNNETIEIIHKAHNRNIFAKGAIEAAIWLLKKQKGLFNMNDMIKS